MFAGRRAHSSTSTDRASTRRALPWLAALTFLLGFGLAEAAPTHYPPNAKCVDCHSTTKATMVVGTRLIKASQATTDLGITQSTPSIKCLFCHRQGAVSVPSTVMKPVWDHFNAQSASKHRASELSDFIATTGAFDCLDCHTQQASSGVIGTAGNATIHGVDASIATLPVAGTLLGMAGLTTYTDAQLSTSTCGNAACHGYVTTVAPVYGSYTTARQHTFANSALNNITANTPTNCVTQCHGSHNSYDNASLVILRDDGTGFNLNTTYASPPTTPEKCGECHKEDDGSTIHQFNTRGHGKSGISLGCTNCHDATKPHSFTYLGTNPMRFSLNLDKSAMSGIRQAPQYAPAASICLTCHSQYVGKIHGNTVIAGCNDCHEVHGTGSPIGSVAINDKMIRPRIEKIGTNGQPIYGFNSTAGTWEPIVFTMSPVTSTWATYRPDSFGLCDNAECHQGRGLGVNSTAIWPLSSFLVGTGHSGGAVNITTTFNCVGCHSHTDSGGGFGGIDSCTGCHATPPATAAHSKHIANAYSCNYCHPGGGTLNHNETNLFGTAAYTAKWNANPEQIRGNVQVAFTDAALPVAFRTGSYSLAQTTIARVGATYGDCNSTGCHGASIPTTDRGTDTSPTWNNPATAACGTCHMIMGTTRPSSGSHTMHVANGRNISCQYCHAGVTPDGASIISTLHANGVNNVAPTVGTYNGLPLTLSYASPTCSNISCHGSNHNLNWGAASSCDNCHGTFLTTGGMYTTVAPKHANSTWAGTGFPTAHAIGTTVGPTACAGCHGNSNPAYITTPGLDMHLDGKIQLSNQNTYTGTSGAGGPGGCGGCHAAIATFLMSDSGYPFQIITGDAMTGGCASDTAGCHGNAGTGFSWPEGTTYPDRAGEHAQHIAAIARTMGWGTTASASWNSSCDFCHPAPFTLGVHNVNVGTGNFATTADLYKDGVNTTGDFKRVDGTVNAVVSSYSVATKTCNNVDCHYRTQTPLIGTLPTPGWLNTGNTASCSSCHAYGGIGSLPLAHQQHIGTAAGQKGYGCNRCHPDWTTGVYTTAHQSNRVNVIMTGTFGTMSLSGGNYMLGVNTTTITTVKYGGLTTYGTCNNLYCHIQNSPAWTATIGTSAQGGCTQCHVKGIVTTGFTPNPSSGLHYGTTAPTITGRFHDDGIATSTSKCGYCHTTVQANATHVDGWWDGGVTTNSVGRMGLGSNFYTQVADGVGYCSGGTLGSTGCHDGGGDGGQWRRRWDRTISYAAAVGTTTCAGCHGGFGTMANFAQNWNVNPLGTHNGSDNAVEHEWSNVSSTNNNQIMGNHSQCSTCHVYPTGLYANLGTWAAGVTTGAGLHGNNQIELNGTDGYTRTAVGTATPAFGCSSTCHSANANHGLENSGWTLHTMDGPSGGCTSCHGPGGSGYWPAGTTYPNRAGEHQQHVDAIALRAMNTTDNAAKNATCNYCHPETGAEGAGYAMTTHNADIAPTGMANLFGDGLIYTVAYYKNMGNVRQAVLGSYDQTNKTCTNLDCHYRNETPRIGSGTNAGWYNITSNSSTCASCHPYVANIGSGITGPGILPGAHMQHVGTSAGQKNYACALCHPNWGTTFNHQSNQVNVIVTGNLGTTAFSALYRLTTAGTNLTTTSVKYAGITTATAGGCYNLYCHPKSPSPVWAATIGTAGAGGCTQCHDATVITGNNPQSGLHIATTPVVTGRRHDDTITTTTGSRCGACHVAVATQATHVNGTFEAGNGQAVQMGLATFYTQVANNVGYCTGWSSGSTGCHDGGGDAGAWRRRWDSAIHYTPVTTTDKTACAGCHGGFGTTVNWPDTWTVDPIGTHNATDGHVEHDYTWGTSVIHTTTPQIIGNHSGNTAEAKCKICHVWPDTPYILTGTTLWLTTLHGNNMIDMNSSMGYTRTGGASNLPAYGCSTNCHTFINTSYGIEGSGWALNTVAGPALTCTSCHVGSGGGAKNVSSASTHTKAGLIGTYSSFQGCEVCHPSAAKGTMHGQAGNASVVLIANGSYDPMTTNLGINYGHSGNYPLLNTTRNGFFLGGTATIGTTEAEICWNCHGDAARMGTTTAASEWGLTSHGNTGPGGGGYDHGSVTSRNWMVATWSSAIGIFSYKTGKLQSFHTALPSSLGGPTSNTGDTVAQVRCSYCHDVHGLKGAMTASPYLRGTWWTNPYLQDGAPRLGMVFVTAAASGTFKWGAVPRGAAAKGGTGGVPTYGGYQIDANNGSPVTTTAAGFAGLCELCHGNGDGTFSDAEINSLNVFGAMTDWVSGYNGHANSVKHITTPTFAGAELTARNIFGLQRGLGTRSWINPNQHYQSYSQPGNAGAYGFRGGTSNALRYSPTIGGYTSSPLMYNQDQWGVDETGGTTEMGYHKFSCSKCHNPHASRLPRLMISNCLDTKHNTWDNSFQVAAASATIGINTGRSISNWTTAQNCHRVGGNDPDDTRENAGFGTGWNTVTPW